jgi:carboxyl-terminal processing protease
MKLGKFKHLFAFLLTAMASITLAFLVRFSLEGIMQPKKLASYSSDKLLEEDFDMEQSASSIANNLLTDSILTIIQNYYVDDSRVKSMELLENGLYFLTEDRKYKLRVDGDRYFLSANSQTLKLDIKEPFDYNQLLDHSFRISRFLSKVEGLEKTYKEDYWQDKGTFKFLNTVLHSLDPHSSLLNSSEYDELKQGTEGTFGGLGVVVSFENSMLRVVKTIDNSPASSVGIKPGNLIVSINGRNTFGLSLDEIISLMRGKSGTKVDLDILAEDAFSTKTVSIHRKVVRVNSVEEEVISYNSKNFLKCIFAGSG